MKINAIYEISESPRIYASTGSKNWHKLPTEEKEKGYLLCHPMWYFSWSSLRLYNQMRRLLSRKNIELILLHNSAREYRFAKLFGFRSYLINQNIHACEHKFQVQEKLKKYDAVYIAAAKPYKRIHLAESIKKLYVITYFWPPVKNEAGEWDLHAFEPRINHADFNRKFLPSTQVIDILNSSHCGLALSKKEGAMWATMEYLLSGLPIVSTESKGGRDFFFDDHYVKIVADHPSDVSEAVEAFKSSPPNPHFIRTNTLQKMEIVRKEFYELCYKLGARTTGSETYEAFSQRLWGGRGIDKLRII